MAGASYLKTAMESTKAAMGGFLLPFMFIYCPVLLLMPQSIGSSILKLIACITSLLALEVGFVGYFWTNCGLREKGLALASAVFLLAFLPLRYPLLLVVGLLLFGLLNLSQWRKKRGGRLAVT